MRPIFSTLTAIALFLSSSAMPALADSFTPGQKSDIENIVREYLLQNPELMQEVFQKLDQKQRQAEEQARNSALKENAAAIFQSPTDPVVGNPKGNVVMVEFMDYNCGWCKRAVGEVADLVKKDPELKVIFKEFPIFGEHSEYAARAALAAAKQGKYWELHQALFAQEGQVTTDVVNDVAASVGIDVEKMKTDMKDPAVEATLAANRAVGQNLQLSGTPAFIIDQTVVPGYLPADELAAKIASVRKAGCTYC